MGDDFCSKSYLDPQLESRSLECCEPVLSGEKQFRVHQGHRARVFEGHLLPPPLGALQLELRLASFPSLPSRTLELLFLFFGTGSVLSLLTLSWITQAASGLSEVYSRMGVSWRTEISPILSRKQKKSTQMDFFLQLP